MSQPEIITINESYSSDEEEPGCNCLYRLLNVEPPMINTVAFRDEVTHISKKTISRLRRTTIDTTTYNAILQMTHATETLLDPSQERHYRKTGLTNFRHFCTGTEHIIDHINRKVNRQSIYHYCNQTPSPGQQAQESEDLPTEPTERMDVQEATQIRPSGRWCVHDNSFTDESSIDIDELYENGLDEVTTTQPENISPTPSPTTNWMEEEMQYDEPMSSTPLPETQSATTETGSTNNQPTPTKPKIQDVIMELCKQHADTLPEPTINNTEHLTQEDKHSIAKYLRELANLMQPEDYTETPTNRPSNETITRIHSHQLRPDGMKFKAEWGNRISHVTLEIVLNHKPALKQYLENLKSSKPKSYNCLVNKYPLELSQL